jgi:succinate dehydrogenase / fumarate reductase cytochrome b subunit
MTTIRSGRLLLSYRGSEGMLAWAFHRISGVALWAFILLHVLDIWLAGAAPDVYDEVLQIYASPIGRVLETLLGAALLYHALNGLRIIIMDFWPAMTRYHKQMWYAAWVVFFVVGIPVAYQIMAPAFGLPQLAELIGGGS